MRIPDFELERYFARHEFSTPYQLGCSDCETFSVGEILALEDGAADPLMELRLHYTAPQGHQSLREAIAGRYEHIEPDQILVHTGAEEAIFNFMYVALNPGDHVIVHWPCYQSLFQVAADIGCQVDRWEALAANGWRLDLEDLVKRLRPETRVVVINSPHNPTGWLMPASTGQALLELSQQYGFIIFSDEVYRFLEYNPAARPPAFCDISPQAVSLGVMSKSYGLPGLRVGWIATRNHRVYQKMAAFKDYTTICNSAPAEYLATIALRHSEKLIGRNLNLIRENLAKLDAFFGRHPDILSWRPPQAGPIAFPSLTGDRSAENFCLDLLEKAGVLILPGMVYGNEYQGHVRIGFGRKNLPDCLDRWAKYLGG